MTALQNATGGVTLALAGKVSADVVPEIDRVIRDGKQTRKQVMLDLSEVTLMDPAAAHFFAVQIRRGIELTDCPIYLRHWILRDRTDDTEK